MSDSPDEFMRKTKEMLDQAERQLDLTGKLFASKTILTVVLETPGPNNQLPETEYYAVGRLRGAWKLGEEPISAASRWDGGPYDEDGLGEAVHEKIHKEIMEAPLKAYYHLNNDVAYGYIVHFGGGRMPYRRRYRDKATSETAQEKALNEAMAEAMR